jgi:hypothetical protein
MGLDRAAQSDARASRHAGTWCILALGRNRAIGERSDWMSGPREDSVVDRARWLQCCVLSAGVLLACSLVLPVAAHAASERPDKAAIEAKVQSMIAAEPWASKASVVVRRGAGRGLSAWLAVVSCDACVQEGENWMDLRLVLGFDRDGVMTQRKLTCGPPNGTLSPCEPE